MSALLLLLSLRAFAADCDANALRKQLADAAPQQAAGLYVQLAKCDADAARRLAPVTLPKILSGEDGYAAATAAVEVGADKAAADWIAALQSDERAGAIKDLGESCQETAAVQQFFLTRAAEMKEAFWTQRWYRALGECRVESVRNLLWAELDKGLGSDRSTFFGVLEAYARNAGGDAVPRLQDLLKRTEDPEAQVNILQAFADAAQVGSEQGMDRATAERAVRAIVEVAPQLSNKGVDQARITLQTLGAEAESDALAAVRYKDRRQEDGTFLWGALVLENATCKKGDKLQRFHAAQVIDEGQTWADQLSEKVKSTAEVGWSMDLAERCKGQGTVEIRTPAAPFASKDEYKAWVEAQVKELTDPAVRRPIRIEEDPVNL